MSKYDQGLFHWATKLQLSVFVISIVSCGYSLFSLLRISFTLTAVIEGEQPTEVDVLKLLLKHLDLFGTTVGVLVVSALLIYGNLSRPPAFYLTFVIVNSFVVFHWIAKAICAHFIWKIVLDTRFFCPLTLALQTIFVLVVYAARAEALKLRKKTTDSTNSRTKLVLSGKDFEKNVP
ncbi:hypothetical protein M3Y99_01755600 [Aphelenchoides fujianensis]|nr:hypothetical protein M3Y99_01755600 [Aphelenchoides fujianensis]